MNGWLSCRIVRMRVQRRCRSFAKRQRQSMKQLVGAIPDILVWANAEIGPKLVFEGLPDETVDTISGDEQIAFRFQ